MSDIKEQIFQELAKLDDAAAGLRAMAVNAGKQTDLEVAILTEQVKKLRDKKYNVRQINQTEHLSLLDNAVAMICVPETTSVFDEKSRIIDLMKKNDLKIGYVVNNAKYSKVNIARIIA